MSNFRSNFKNTVFGKFQKDKLNKNKLKKNGENKIQINIIPEKPEDILEILPFEKKEKRTQNHPVDDFRELYKEVDEYINMLNKDYENPVKSKFLKKEEIQKKIREMEDLKLELEDFGDLQKIDYEENLSEDEDQEDEELQNLKKKTENLKDTIVTKHNPDELYLTSDLSVENTLISLKMIENQMEKLKSLDLIIGNRSIFKEKSLLAQLQTEFNELDLLEPSSITHTTKKLNLIKNEIQRLEGDKEKNFFSTKKEQRELFDTAGELAYAIKEYEKEYEPNHLVKIYRNIENNQYFIEKASFNLLEAQKIDKILEDCIKEGKENALLLKNVSDNIDKGIKTIEKNNV